MIRNQLLHWTDVAFNNSKYVFGLGSRMKYACDLFSSSECCSHSLMSLSATLVLIVFYLFLYVQWCHINNVKIAASQLIV